MIICIYKPLVEDTAHLSPNKFEMMILVSNLAIGLETQSKLLQSIKVSIRPTGFLLFWYLSNVQKGIPRKKIALAEVHMVSAIVTKDFSMGIGA